MSEGLTRQDLFDMEERMNRRILEHSERLHKDMAEIVGRVGAQIVELSREVTGLKSEVTGLKSEVTGLKSDVTALKSEVAALKSDVTELRADMVEMEKRLNTRIDERCEKVETNLLTAFHSWARPMEIRVRGIATVSMGVEERLGLWKNA